MNKIKTFLLSLAVLLALNSNEIYVLAGNISSSKVAKNKKIATTITWTGATNTSWNNTGNWSSGTIPTSTDDVIIPSTSNNPTMGTNSLSCKSLTIDNGATLTLSKDFTVNGSITNNGTFAIGNKTLTISGSGNLSGTGSITYGNGSIAISSGTVSIANGQSLSLPAIDIALGATLSNSGSVAFNDNVTGSGTFTNETGGSAVIWTTLTCSTLNLSNTNNSVTFNKAGNQSIPTTTYYNLNLANSGNKTISANITVNGDLSISGSAALKGTSLNVNLYGSLTASNSNLIIPTINFLGSNSQIITGNNPVYVSNITINKTNNDITLLNNLDIDNTGSLTFTSKNLDLNGYSLNIQSGGTMTGESSSSKIIGSSGTITASTTISSNSTVNVGNLGATISGNGKNLGTVTVTRGHSPQVSDNGKTSFARYYDISISGTNTGLNSTLVFSYLDSELNGQTEDKIKLYKSVDGGVTWSLQDSTKTSVNTSSNTVTLTGITSFSKWTASNSGTNPLPVVFASFNGSFNENNVILNWATTTEINNDYFVIEASTDGENFTTVGTLKGKGNSSNKTNYTFTDFQNENSILYYRLKQVDLDGKFAYSNIIIVSNNISNNNLNIFPNPNKDGNIYLSHKNVGENQYTYVAIYDSEQKLHFSEEYYLSGSGITKIYLNEHQKLSKGIYFVHIQTNDGVTVEKLVIE